MATGAISLVIHTLFWSSMMSRSLQTGTVAAAHAMSATAKASSGVVVKDISLEVSVLERPVRKLFADVPIHQSYRAIVHTVRRRNQAGSPVLGKEGHHPVILALSQPYSLPSWLDGQLPFFCTFGSSSRSEP